MGLTRRAIAVRGQRRGSRASCESRRPRSLATPGLPLLAEAFRPRSAELPSPDSHPPGRVALPSARFTRGTLERRPSAPETGQFKQWLDEVPVHRLGEVGAEAPTSGINQC
jgi:hypothetical protein